MRTSEEIETDIDQLADRWHTALVPFFGKENGKRPAIPC